MKASTHIPNWNTRQVSSNAPFRYKEHAPATQAEGGTKLWYLSLESMFRTVYNYWSGEHIDEINHDLIKDPKRRYLGKLNWLTRERIIFWYNGVVRFLLMHIDDLVEKLDERDSEISKLRSSSTGLHQSVAHLRAAVEVRDDEIRALKFALVEISKLHAREDPIEMEPWL